jgi:hypothetical protein
MKLKIVQRSQKHSNFEFNLKNIRRQKYDSDKKWSKLSTDEQSMFNQR